MQSEPVVELSIDMQNAKETVAPVFTKVNSAAKQQYSKALENERVKDRIYACTPVKGSRAQQHLFRV